MSIESLPASVQNLPGVKEAAGPNASAPTAEARETQPLSPQEFVFEGSGTSRASAARTETLEKEFDFDLKQNPQLERSLAEAGTPTNSRGLATVSNKANRYPKQFTALVSASKDVAISLGKNPGAQGKLESTRAVFNAAANITANNTGDVTYLLVRIAAESSNADSNAIRNSVQQQKANNEKLVSNLQQYERDLLRTYDSTGESGSKLVAESDFQINSRNEVERVTDSNSTGVAKGVVNVDASGRPQTGWAGLGGSATKTSSVPAPFSQKNPVKLVQMNKSQMWAEILETRQQITSLQKANAVLARPMAPPSTVPIQWFVGNTPPRGGSGD